MSGLFVYRDAFAIAIRSCKIRRGTEAPSPNDPSVQNEHGPVSSVPKRNSSLLKKILDLTFAGFSGWPVSITWSPVSEFQQNRSRAALTDGIRIGKTGKALPI